MIYTKFADFNKPVSLYLRGSLPRLSVSSRIRIYSHITVQTPLWTTGLILYFIINNYWTSFQCSYISIYLYLHSVGKIMNVPIISLLLLYLRRSHFLCLSFALIYPLQREFKLFNLWKSPSPLIVCVNMIMLYIPLKREQVSPKWQWMSSLEFTELVAETSTDTEWTVSWTLHFWNLFNLHGTNAPIVISKMNGCKNSGETDNWTRNTNLITQRHFKNGQTSNFNQFCCRYFSSLYTICCSL